MAIQSTISFQTIYRVNNSPTKDFKLVDNSPYGAEGIALADVVGVFKIVDPTGATIYNNTNFGAPDIDADVSLEFTGVAIPLDSNGDPVKGNYSITYTIRVAGGVQPGDYPLTKGYNYQYTAPIPDLDIVVDYFCSKITSTDNTPYPAGTVIDQRVHTLHPPDGSGLADTVGSTVVIATSPITNKTWTAEIDTDITVTFSADGLMVEDTIAGTNERKVDDSQNLCQLHCCLKAIIDRYNAKLSTNEVEAARIQREQLTPALVNAFAFRNAIECGLTDQAQVYFSNVLKFSECDPSCACDDSENPVLIPAICSAGAGSTFVVDACGANNAITVSANTVGSTTTYTVCFNQAIFDKISNLNAGYVVDSADLSVTVVSSIDANGVETFDLSVASSSVPSIVGQRIDITLTSSGLPSVVVDKDTLYGVLLQKPAVVSDNIGGGFGAWTPKNNCWEVSGYDVSAGGLDIKPQLQVTKLVDQNGVDYDCDSWIDLCAKVVSIDYATGIMKFRFAKGNGQQVTNQALIDLFTKIEVSLTLTA